MRTWCTGEQRLAGVGEVQRAADPKQDFEIFPRQAADFAVENSVATTRRKRNIKRALKALSRTRHRWPLLPALWW
jgi:hypothetical protein